MTAKLLTKADEAVLPPLRSTERTPDPMVVVKWFSPYTGWTWYATEGEATEDGWEFFGLVVGLEAELGYWTLGELASATGMGGKLPLVERDRWWRPTPLSKIRAGEVT